MNQRLKLILLAVIIVSAVKADEVANVKTNLLYDLTSTINLGAEVGLNRHLSLDLSGNYNSWTLTDGMKIRHWLLQPELRWWPRERMSGHFVGFHIVGGEYNLDKAQLLYNVYPTLRDYRFEGWGIGAGIAWGYRWNFSRRLAMEGEIGVGAIHSKWDRYACGDCGERLGSGTQTYVGPTKLALNLIYRFGPTDKKKSSHANGDDIPVRIVEKVRVDTVYITRDCPQADDHASAMQSTIPIQFTLRLSYPLDSDLIDPSLGTNSSSIDSLRNFLDNLPPQAEIERILITGYSSIEGNESHNMDLSRRRAASTGKLVESMRPDITPYMETVGAGEDWNSLAGMLPDLGSGNADSREAALRRHKGGLLFNRLMEGMLPSTRRTEIKIFLNNNNK